MKNVVFDVEAGKERKIFQVWWYGTREIQVKKIQSRDFCEWA